MPDIPKLGLATGFGVIGFGIAFIVTDRWIGQDVLLDIAIGAIVAAIAWLVLIMRGKDAK